MIADRIIYHEVATPSDIVEVMAHHDDETYPTEERYVVYQDVPAGLIDLPSAARKYGVNLKTAGGWLRRGLIPRMGKLRAPGPGGGYNLTCETAFAGMARLPKNYGGRPRKR